MKLLPLACFAASAAQSGDYDYGAASTEDDDRHSSYGYNSYGDYDDYGNKKNKWTFGGKAIGSHQSIAVALNCWPANFDTDTLMTKDITATNPIEANAFGPIHLYGTEVEGNDPGMRAGLGGHYAYGHAHHAGVPNTIPSEWVHYHSARHAGCLYEIPEFSYNAVTWDRVFHLWYFNGYYDKTDTTTKTSTQVAANLDGVTYDTNWVHFFNAHVLKSAGRGASLAPETQSNANSIKIVMANPQFEGLGWLNFVATYGRSTRTVGENYLEFADSTHVTTTGLGATLRTTYNTYSAINSSPNQQTQGITGNYYYDAWMGTWEMNMDDTDTWTTTYTEGVPSVPTALSFGGLGELALSSFPHNELGKDFRFNMRVLLEDSTSAGARKMYYFYKINSITVTFPSPVAYALVYDGRETNTASGATSNGGVSDPGAGNTNQGTGIYNVGQNAIRDNIIPPLDLGSHFDASFGAHDPSTNLHHRITGYLSGVAANSCDVGDAAGYLLCADFCRSQVNPCLTDADTNCGTANLEEHCSTKFIITGLLNTYSERLGGQRGTYQEIWVQLQYAMGHTPAVGTAKISSPFPYLHFMANEVTTSFGCDTTNVDNGNTCDAFNSVAYKTHDFGYGG